MALIECPECGKMISNYAKECKGCGISMTDIIRIIEEKKNPPKILVCPECGTEFEETREDCPECGFPVEMINKKGIETYGWETPQEISCAVCETGYSSAENLCPKCSYPKLTISADNEKLKKAVDVYRKKSGISIENHIALPSGSSNVGDIIKFGRYEQGKGEEPIEWKVLDKKDNKALVISRYGLDCKRYNEKLVGITWENCTLRGWLNNEFISKAFNSEEQAAITTTLCTADKNSRYSTNPGNDTKDKIFLLSIKEAKQYFKSGKCVPTGYAKAKGLYTSDTYTVGGKATCWWWLRSPGKTQNYAASVSSGDSVDYGGHGVGRDDGAVRPALWINL